MLPKIISVSLGEQKLWFPTSAKHWCGAARIRNSNYRSSLMSYGITWSEESCLGYWFDTQICWYLTLNYYLRRAIDRAMYEVRSGDSYQLSLEDDTTEYFLCWCPDFQQIRKLGSEYDLVYSLFLDLDDPISEPQNSII